MRARNPWRVLLHAGALAVLILALPLVLAASAQATPIVAALDSLDYGSELDVQSRPGGAFQFNNANCATTPCYGELCLSSSTPCAGTVYLRDSLAKIKVLDTTCNQMVTGYCYNKGTPSGPGHGGRFYTCARGYYTSTNVTAWKCSDGSTIDNQPPYRPSYIYDGGTQGSDIAYQLTTTSLSMNIAAMSDNGVAGIQGYRYCFTSSTLPGTPPYTCNGSVHNSSLGSSVNGFGATFSSPYTATGLALAGGTTYYSCIAAMDKVYNKSGWYCSNGVRIDTDTPLPPGAAYDGTSGDIDWQTSTTTLAANWTAGSDSHSGVANYGYCFSTGLSCSGTVVASGSTTALSVSRSALTLTNGTLYYACVRTYDRAGRVSAYRCSDGVRIDASAPGAPAAVRDGTGADITWQTWATSIAANWDSSSDVGSGVSYYRYCVSTAVTCAGTVVIGWTSTSLTSFSRSITLTAGTTYYSCVYAVDVAGNAGASRCSNGVTVDTAAPSAPPAVRDGTGTDVQWTSSSTSLSLNWDASADAVSGVGSYQYCLATLTSCGGTIVASWTNVGAATLSATRTALALSEGQVYYACVRAVDRAGNIGTMTCSNGQVVDTAVAAPASIADGSAADIDWQQSTSALTTNWAAVTDAVSGLARYETCVSSATVCTGTIIGASWSNAGTATSDSRTGLALAVGSTWFACVRAVDRAGNISTVACSDGVTITAPLGVTAASPSSVAQGRSGAVVRLTGTGFTPDTSVAVSGTGITLGGVTFVNDTTLDVTVSVASTATVAAYDITVGNADGSNSTGIGLLSVVAPSISVTLSTLGYQDASRTTSPPHAIGFGSVVAGASQAVGPAGSGQLLAGPALEVGVTADTDTLLQLSSSGWSDGTQGWSVGGLSWAVPGSGAWTAFTSTAATVTTLAAGTSTTPLDMTLAVPSGQRAGAYSATLDITVIMKP